MTDVSAVKAYADPQPAPVAYYTGPPPPPFLNGSPALDGAIEEEESSTIKCICGFSDDDGNTVLCEKCDTWQHISCYYEATGHVVPDVHECADCAPRPVDIKGAAERQRQRREQHNIGERKGRPRTSTKSHKKRAKDPLAIVQPNGWAVHANTDLHYNSERKSGSPREQGPPAKRPKTNHRPSNSVHVISQVPTLAPGSRKRTGSVMFNGHSPVKSPTEPDGPTDDYSIEFMNLYRQPERPSTDSNSYTDLRVANDIASWLSDRDALAEATGGMAPAEVFQRIEQTMEDMEASHAPTVSLQTDEDSNILAHGLHPQWQFLMLESPVAEGGFIGELKGRIGRKQDYYSDPANRWDVLRHPEPFVFFPPHLPIYIDTRHEGTLLRYARRSCNPNMVMKILTQGPDYHFCFLATRDIDVGEELTVGWDIDSEIQQHLQKAVTNGDIKKEGFRKIQPWVTGVLANFGGCACDQSTGYGCLLERARRNATTYAEPVQPLKTTKGKKTKKGQFSPLSTGHATNSRAGSEAVHRDAQDDEHMESRSTSGSHKSTSRDITPATHFSVDDSNSKLSERERRKLQQQERLFEQLEEDQHKVKRGKRNSAGSTLNTPGLSSSKQLGQSEHSPSLRNHREHSNGVARKTSGSSNKTNGRVIVKPKPVYVDSCTQTETESTPTPVPTPVKARVIRPPVSFKRKLLLQAQEDKLQRDRFRSASVKVEAQSPALVDVASSKPSPKTPTAPPEDTVAMDIVTESAVEEPNGTNATPAEEPDDAPVADVEMPDAEEPAAPRPPSPKVEKMPDAAGEDVTSTPSHPPIQPPPPPWPTSASEAQSTLTSEPPATQPEPPRLEVPIKPDPAEPAPSADNAVTPESALVPSSNSVVTQSLVGIAPPSPFSPAVTSAVTPGPARKKLSLSAYTSRRAKLAQQTSQSGVISSPSVKSPTMANSSLPHNASLDAKAIESGLPSVTEERKSPPPAVTAAVPSTSSV